MKVESLNHKLRVFGGKGKKRGCSLKEKANLEFEDGGAGTR